MQETPVQILEVRAGEGERPLTITAAVNADASRAIFTALSEQLDRRRREQTASVEDVLALREQTALVERFAPLANAGAHAIVQVTEADLRTCLLALTDYTARVDGEHFQPVDLRKRLHVIAQITPVLWDANATAAAAAAATTGQSLRTPRNDHHPRAAAVRRRAPTPSAGYPPQTRATPPLLLVVHSDSGRLGSPGPSLAR
jgi:hypothetical protein